MFTGKKIEVMNSKKNDKNPFNHYLNRRKTSHYDKSFKIPQSERKLFDSDSEEENIANCSIENIPLMKENHVKFNCKLKDLPFQNNEITADENINILDDKSFTDDTDTSAIRSSKHPGPEKRIGNSNNLKHIIDENYPYSTIGLIVNSTEWEEIWEGSGFLVGPSIVLTAAHVVSDNLNYYFYPGTSKLYQNDEKCKVIQKTIIKYNKNIDNNANNLEKYNTYKNDWAILILDQPIGEKKGWLGLSSYKNTDLINKSIITIGFPADKNDSSVNSKPRPYESSGIIKALFKSNKKVNSSAKLFSYNISTYYGNSGGPILEKIENDFRVLGIHVAGDIFKGKEVLNYGVRLTKKKFNQINIAVMNNLTDNILSQRRILRSGIETRFYQMTIDIAKNVENKKEIFEIMLKEADQGTNSACYYVGYLYEKNYIGVEDPLFKASLYYFKGAMSKEKDALCIEAVKNLSESGFAEAVKYFKKTALKKNKSSLDYIIQLAQKDDEKIIDFILKEAENENNEFISVVRKNCGENSKFQKECKKFCEKYCEKSAKELSDIIKIINDNKGLKFEDFQMLYEFHNNNNLDKFYNTDHILSDLVRNEEKELLDWEEKGNKFAIYFLSIHKKFKSVNDRLNLLAEAIKFNIQQLIIFESLYEISKNDYSHSYRVKASNIIGDNFLKLVIDRINNAETDKDKVHCLYILSLAYVSKKFFEEALKYTKISYDIENSDVFNELFTQGDSKIKIKIYEFLFNKAVESQHFYSIKYIYKLSKKEPEKMGFDFFFAILSTVENSQILYLCGKLLLKTGKEWCDPQKARGYFDKVCDLKKGFVAKSYRKLFFLLYNGVKSEISEVKPDYEKSIYYYVSYFKHLFDNKDFSKKNNRFHDYKKYLLKENNFTAEQKLRFFSNTMEIFELNRWEFDQLYKEMFKEKYEISIRSEILDIYRRQSIKNPDQSFRYLGKIYRKGDKIDNLVEQNHQEAFDYFKKSNHEKSFYKLGNYYNPILDEKLNIKSYTHCVDYYKKAGDKKEEKSIKKLILLLELTRKKLLECEDETSQAELIDQFIGGSEAILSGAQNYNSAAMNYKKNDISQYLINYKKSDEHELYRVALKGNLVAEIELKRRAKISNSCLALHYYLDINRRKDGYENRQKSISLSFLAVPFFIEFEKNNTEFGDYNLKWLIEKSKKYATTFHKLLNLVKLHSNLEILKNWLYNYIKRDMEKIGNYENANHQFLNSSAAFKVGEYFAFQLNDENFRSIIETVNKKKL